MNSFQHCELYFDQSERVVVRSDGFVLTDYTLVDTNHFKIRVNESTISSEKKKQKKKKQHSH